MSKFRLFIITLAFGVLSGCISTEVIPGTDGGSFVVVEDLIAFQQGVLGPPKLVGLTPGEYIAVGHNGSGVFYRGPRGGVLILQEEAGHHYLETGERPIDVSQGLISGGCNGEGGVFIPYDPTGTPWLFYYGDFRRMTGDIASGLPPRPPSKINTYTGDAPVGQAADTTAPKAVVVDPQTYGVSPTPQNVLGVGIGVGIGGAIGNASLRGAQGKAMRSFDVEDPKLLAFLHASVHPQEPHN